MGNEDTPASKRGGSIQWLTFFIISLWVIEVVDRLLPGLELDTHGIQPRSRDGLWGIVFAPFLHGNWKHLAANTIPLAILGVLVILRGKRELIWVSIVMTLLGGLGVWLIGQPQTNHIGASGLVFGYLGFVLFGVYWCFSWMACVAALLAAFLYGGLLYGMLPGEPGISWEGHACGFAAGGLTAFIFAESKAE